MTPLPRFRIHQPESPSQAVGVLAEFGEDARPYAGGTELLLAMDQAGLRYGHLIDIKTIAGIEEIALIDGWLRIGAGATHAAIVRSSDVARSLPSLVDLETTVANPRVRATGTLAGNLCFAEPHSDPAVLLLCLDARMRVFGPHGERQLPLAEFIVGPYVTALEPDEIVIGIDIPIPARTRRSAYAKFQIHERPLLGIAVDLTIEGDRVVDARVGLGSVVPRPVRFPGAEAMLRGPLEELRDHLELAGDIVSNEAEVSDDQDGQADYKQHLVRIFLRRVMSTIIDRWQREDGLPSRGRGLIDAEKDAGR